LKFNESFIPALGNSAAVENIVRAKAEQVANAARTSAPVDTGDYRSSIRVKIVRTRFRTVAKIVADSDHSMLVESKHGTLARALRAATNG
jgi:intein/homing endonuclease